jgi:opacity protein-like surface antigen
MSMNFRNFLVLGFLLVFSLEQNLQAQNTAGSDSGSAAFGFRSAGISIGWYKPSMNFWNDTYFADTARLWENTFKGNLFYSGFIELNIIKNLRVKASGSYWTETVKSGVIPINEVTGTEQLTTSLTSISLDVIYRLGFLSFEKFSPYAGLGGSFVFVQNKMVSTPDDNPEESSTNQGQDVTGTLIAGIERTFGNHFGAAIDFRYILGSYAQEMKDVSNNVTTHPVSLSGPQIGLSLYYILK